METVINFIRTLLSKGVSFKWTWKFGYGKKTKEKDLRFDEAVRASEGTKAEAITKRRTQ